MALPIQKGAFDRESPSEDTSAADRGTGCASCLRRQAQGVRKLPESLGRQKVQQKRRSGNAPPLSGASALAGGWPTLTMIL